MTIQVVLGGENTAIDRDVFVALLDNSVVCHLADYTKALESGRIKFDKLVELTRKAEVPYPLLFAPLPVVEAQLAGKTQKLLQGVAKEQFSMNARGSVELRDVELIVKDLLRKQELYKRHAHRLPKKNPLVGCITRPATAEQHAATIWNVLQLSGEELRAQKTKQGGVDLFIERLEGTHVLVARSVRGYMPQTLDKVQFSGMTIRDPKVPYIFMAGGNHGEDEDPTGRQLFTLALFSVMIGRKVFRAVTMDTTSLMDAPPTEYGIAAEMLMPAALIRVMDLSSVEAIGTAADVLKVTPSAVVVRAHNLKLMSWEVAGGHLRDLGDAFRAKPKSQARSPLPVNAVRKYNGARFTRTMLTAVDQDQISVGEFCRVVGSRKIGSDDLEALRQATK